MNKNLNQFYIVTKILFISFYAKIFRLNKNCKNKILNLWFKKLFSIILIVFLNNCVAANIKDFHSERDRLKVQKMRPSESMQAGVPRIAINKFSSKQNNSLDQYYLDNNDSDFAADDEIKLPTVDDEYLIDDLNFNSTDLSDEEIVGDNKNYSGHYKIGKPYSAFGISYEPKEYDSYEEIGTASWYGPDFHGKKTANGEIYNMGDLTAAHPTLPLPSLVLVTNLKNGKSKVLRVNDRGPFAKNRVIDVSEKAAEVLGFKAIGTTKVKVELLRRN